MGAEYRPGEVVWANFGRPVGREQAGWRPAVIVSSLPYARLAKGLTIVVPCTTRARGWRSHVPVVGDVRVEVPTYAMTEQPRTMSHGRIAHRMGRVHPRCAQDIAHAVKGWLDQPPLFRR